MTRAQGEHSSFTVPVRPVLVLQFAVVPPE